MSLFAWLNREWPLVFVYLIIFLNIASIFVCHYIAKSRGKPPVFWGVMGALFGPLAIPFALAWK